MERFLVTGAAGFIGTNLVKALLERGDGVVGIDNFSYGREENLRSLDGHADFQLVRGDVLDQSALRRAAAGVDQIVHLAAHKIPRYGDALDTLIVNTEGTRNVLEVARHLSIRVVLASTSDVYGKSRDLPFVEDGDLVLGPSTVRRWSYAVSKLYDEQLAFAYGERFGVPFAVVRLFGGFGPYQNLTWWGGPQSVFIRCALTDQPMPLHGDGEQTRCLTYVDDLIDGFLRLLDAPEIDGEVINLGSQAPITMRELAERCWRLVREDEPRIHYVPYTTFGRYEDVRDRAPNLDKAGRLLGYRVRVGLDEGLERTVAWQREAMQLPRMAGAAGPSKVVFIAPAFNEAENLPRLAQQIAGGAELLGLDYQLLIVDDGSTDATASVTAELAQSLPVERLEHASNLGVGAAFNSGFARALEMTGDRDLIVTLEADCTSDMAILPEMYHQIAQGRDLVLASCYEIGGGVVNTNAWRLFLSHCANGSAKLVFGLHGVSTLSSFYRMMRASTLRRVAEVQGAPILASRGFECMLELLVRCHDLGLDIAEVPMVLDSSRRRGTSKMDVGRTISGYLRLYAQRLLGGRMRSSARASTHHSP